MSRSRATSSGCAIRGAAAHENCLRGQEVHDAPEPVRAQGGAGRDEIDDRVCEPEPRRGLDRARDGNELACDPTLREQPLRRDGVRGRDPESLEVGSGRNIGVGRRRDRECASPEPELGEHRDGRLRLGDEVRSGDPEIDHAVLDVLGNVVGAHEQQVDRRVRAGNDQRSLGRFERQPGVGEQPKRRLRQAALRRDRDGETSVPAYPSERRAHARPRGLDGTAMVRRPSRPTSPSVELTPCPCLPSRSLEDEAVAARSVPQPLGDAGHGRCRGRHTLGDLEVRHPLLEQQRRLPPVRQRLQLGQRAEVAQEPPRLVARSQKQHGVGQCVQPGDGLDRLSGRPGRDGSRCHVAMLA